MEHSIQAYEHPYLTVDGAIFRFHNGALEVLLHRRDDRFGQYALPGGFVDIDKAAEDTLHQKILEKTGVSGFYTEQLKTYDAVDRDPRGRVISIVYLGLLCDDTCAGEWFSMDKEKKTLSCGSVTVPLAALAFDHAAILRDAFNRLAGKLWWSNLPKYLLPEFFTISEIEALFTILEGVRTGMLRRKLGTRVAEVGLLESTGGRPAKVYTWKGCPTTTYFS